MNKPSSKPSPFSSLLSIKKRRVPGDTSISGVIGVTSVTEQPPVSEIDATLLLRADGDATKQALPPEIQAPQAFGTLEHLVASDKQPHQAVGTTAQVLPANSQLVQASGTAAQPVTPPIQTLEGGRDAQSYQTAGDTAIADGTEQASLPPIQLHRTAGVTNPTAVRLARDPLGKRSHPGYTRMTVYVQKQTHDDFKLVADLAREEMSEIVEKLIEDYTKARKKDLIRSFAG